VDEEEAEFLTGLRFGAERHPEGQDEVDTTDPDWWNLDAG